MIVGTAMLGREATLAGGTGVRTATLASGMGGQVLPMSIVRILPPGSAGGIINEVKSLAFSTGNEYAIVRLANVSRALVSGGSGGISFVPGQVTRVIGHIDPYGLGASGASAADFAAIRALGQVHSYVLEGGQFIRFGP